MYAGEHTGGSAGLAEKLSLAVRLHQKGELARATSLYQEIIAIDPANADALHLLGVAFTQAGHAERAIELIRQAVKSHPDQPVYWSNLGNAYLARGACSEALPCFDRAAELRPDYLVAVLNRAICLIRLDRFAEAENALAAPFLLNCNNADVLINRGVARIKLGRYRQAIEDFDGALRVRPDNFDSVYGRAVAHEHLAQPSEAAHGYEQALLLRPGHVDSLIGRAAALMKLGEFAQSLTLYEQVLQAVPDAPSIYNDKGLVLHRLNRYEESLQAFDAALILQPESAKALNNRGWILRQLGRPEEALVSLQDALTRAPGFVEALVNLGAVFRDLERFEDAVSCFAEALKLSPDHPDGLGNLGTVLMKQQRFEEAIEVFDRLRRVAPEAEYAVGNIFICRQRMADWSSREELTGLIRIGVAEGRPDVDPFTLLAITDDPAELLACARTFSTKHLPATDDASPPPARGSASRIRVAYLSGEFRDHAVAYLSAGLFEHHDRSQFEIIGVSLRPRRETEMGRRLVKAFDEFIDISSIGDAAAVSKLRDLKVDIVVDLAGWTGANRTGVLKRRAAPLQVSFLGFPGSLGHHCMDYIIADDFVIPPASRGHYSEQVVYMPFSFQVNDSKRRISTAPISRKDQGLAEDATVFCSFNNTYKLNPNSFDVWARIMRRVDDSVLWLLADNEATKINLQREAACRGIAPERLVFAARCDYAHHLKRLSLADLFLDSLPFNAGTTASDSLWAGVPLITCAGRSFAGRMSGSLLKALGMPELITEDIRAFEELAVHLASDRHALGAVRRKLAAQRLSQPLFNTALYARHLESAFREMLERHSRGEPPSSFYVAQ